MAIKLYARHFQTRRLAVARKAISEAELVRVSLLLDKPSVCRRGRKSHYHHAQEKWQSLRQPQPSPALPLKVATIAISACRLPSANNILMMRHGNTLRSLLPALDLTTRAHARALLWGGQPGSPSNGWRWRICCSKPAMPGNWQRRSACWSSFGLPAENF
ncbi:hypothetical protein KCP78_06800 [Salmonella enterica subsp. enterica]|nr:hypothetical protein KCP78_06800 [Salmonella enterica subsp. enterica]